MTLYHRVFQQTGMTPNEFDAKPLWVQQFIAASVKTAMEENKGGGKIG